MPRPALRRTSLAAAASTATAAPGTNNGNGHGSITPGKGHTKDDPTPDTEAPVEDLNPVAIDCYEMPDAAALSTEVGRTIDVLYPHQGRIFYGYGDYTANTGSMSLPYGTNISSFDPATGTTKIHLAGFKTEEIDTFRTIDGHLYVPNIDPSRGADNYNSFASDAGEAGAAPGTWAENPGAWNSVHVYDVAKAGGDLFIAGSTEWSNATDGAAIMWRSTDNGITWTESFKETEDDPAYRNGFERYYWTGVIGDKVYTRAALNLPYPEVAKLRVFDTTTDTWSVVNEQAAAGFGSGIYDGHDVLPWDGKLWATNGQLTWFDGKATGVVSTVPVTTTKGKDQTSTWVHVGSQSIGDDGRLYVMDHEGKVFRIDHATTTTGTASKGQTKKTASTSPYVATHVGTVAAASAAFTVAGGQIWASGIWGQAHVCSYALKG